MNNSMCLTVFVSNLRKEVPAKTDLKTCLRTLRIITRNLLDHPEDARYRSLRVSNPALNTNVFQRDSAVKYLELIGFREEVDADGQPFRSCTDQINRDLLERALSIIERLIQHRPFHGSLTYYTDITDTRTHLFVDLQLLLLLRSMRYAVRMEPHCQGFNAVAFSLEAPM